VAATGIDKGICTGESTSIGEIAIPGNTYSWVSSPAGFTSTTANPTVSPTTTTTYILAETITATGCSKRNSVTVTVNPLPSASTGNDKGICFGSSTAIGDAGISSNTYSWISNPAGFTSSLANPTVLPTETTIYTLTETIPSTGCSKSNNIIVTVNPLPSASTGTNSFICAGTSTSIGSASVSGCTYSWVSRPEGFISNSSNPTVSPLSTTTYILTEIVTATGCSRSDSVIITVSPAPQPHTITGGGNYCSNTPGLEIGLDGSEVGVLYQLLHDETPIGNPVQGTGSAISFGLQTLAGFYSVLATENIAFCSSSMIGSATIGITTSPNSFFSYNLPNCANEGIQFTDLSFTLYGNIKQWVWNYGDGTDNDTINFPDEPNLVHYYQEAGVYNATLYVINSFDCKDAYTIPVHVIPNPIANYYFYGNCEGQVVQFQDASFANGPGNLVAWYWNFGDPGSGVNNTSDIENPQHTFADTGTYLVSLIAVNYNNCRDTMNKLVTIYLPPTVDFVHSQVCLNSPATFSPIPGVVNISYITDWLWDFGDGITSTERNTIHQYNTTGTFLASLTITDSLGCSNSISKQIVVNALPVAHFDAGNFNCSGSEVTFANFSNSPTGIIVRWNYDFGDGSSQTILYPDNPTITHTYSLPRSYPVLLSVQSSDSCWNTELQQLEIKPGAIANFDYDAIPCSNEPVSFLDITQLNGGGSIVQWLWDFGDPTSAGANQATVQNPTHQFSASGSYTVTLHVALGNGCESEIQKTIVILPEVPVDFLVGQRCEDYPAVFEPNASVVNIPDVNSWFWDFGDGVTSPLPSPQHTYPNPGNYQVTLTITDVSGCSNTVLKEVVIIPKPSAEFNISSPLCSDATSQFTSLAFAAYGYIVKWQWDFGDGNTTTVLFPDLPDVSHQYANYGNYTASLTVTTNDSCENTVLKIIQVAPNPLADFNYDVTCRNAAVEFDDLSQSGAGGLISWKWDFGDPASGSNNTSSLQDASHIFSSASIYSVKLITYNTGGCSDTVTKQVTIHELPMVNFTSAAGCENDSTQFISSTFVNENATVSRLWDFGDGYTSPEIDPYHIYASTGSYTVSLTVTDTAGCINSITHVVSISPPPIAFFQSSALSCSNYPMFFTDLSTVANSQFISWFWDFGDGSDTLINAPLNPDISHIYTISGSYPVTLKVVTAQGCEAIFTQTVNVLASPLAGFSFTNTCLNSAVSFVNLTSPNNGTAIVNYSWNFGDPGSGLNNTSNLQNPQHIYNATGSYTVLLQSFNTNGCPDTISHVVTIQPKPPVDFSWANTCIGNATEFSIDATITNLSAVQTFDWDFGDGTAHSYQQDPTHTYQSAGNYTVSLTIADTAGCENSISHSISVLPKPNAQFGISSACEGATTHFTDLSFTSNGEPIASWHWDFGVSTTTNDTSNIQNASWIFSTAGTYNVSLVVTSLSGCQDTSLISMQVYGKPTAVFTYTAAPCNDGAVYFQDSSYNQQVAIIGWDWEFEPNHYSTLQNPVYVFGASDSCFNVRLIATDVRGCVDTVVNEVCVPAGFSFTFAASTTCFRDTTHFTPQLLAPLSDSLVFFNWNFGETNSGINNTSMLKYPSHYYSQPGTYTVSLKSIDINNCPKTVYKEVTILPLPVPLFSYSNAVCDSTVYFNESSSGSGSGIYKWVWDFGDGAITTILSPNSPDLTHHYQSVGIFTSSLTVTNSNGCSNTIVDSNLFVKPCIKAMAEVIDTLICQNNILAFSDSSYSGLPTNQWYWDFGDGSDTTYYVYSDTVNHVFGLPGDFVVKMKVSSALAGHQISDSTLILVTVNPSPIPEFSATAVCFKNEADFTNMTSGNGTLISGYSWNFGEPISLLNDTSSLKNPSHLYNTPGTYQVKLSAINTLGCADSIVKPMQVFALPDANFNYSLSCAGDKTSFTDLSVLSSAPLESWRWEFSESTKFLGTSDNQNTDFIFNVTGNYLVNLMVIDTNGCYDTINQHVKTWNIPTSIYTYTDNFNGVQGQLQFANLSIDGEEYYWDFGNGNESYAQNPVAFFQNDGTYDISLVTWSDKGCTDTLTMKYEFLVKGLYVPNAFSPENPNESVRLLKPVGINIMEYKFEVFDRWDNLLWWSDKLDNLGQPTEGWDGTYNGVLLQQGVYVWSASAVFKDGTVWDADSVGNTENLSKRKSGTAVMIR
jgi:PKD repeat protein